MNWEKLQIIFLIRYYHVKTYKKFTYLKPKSLSRIKAVSTQFSNQTHNDQETWVYVQQQ